MRRLAVLLIVLVFAGCHSANRSRPPIVQPGAPGESSRSITAASAADLPAAAIAAADVRFVQGMIGHHAQALEMTALVAARSRRDDVRLLARRIEASQADEIRMMQEWLTLRGEAVPEAHAHHATMPGMLSADEMRRLAEVDGAAFDRLFLELMIKHHAGALRMVEELLAQPEAARDEELSAFAADVDVDQRAEIARMAAMLMELRP